MIVDHQTSAVDHVMSPHQDHITKANVASKMIAGLRVTCGPDWEYEPVHHLEGTVKACGTVKGLQWMLVRWDSGTTGQYRMGVFHKYDLQLAPASWPWMFEQLTANDLIRLKQSQVDEGRLHVSSFVDPLPDFLKCEMCDDVLTDPCLTDCCDQSYCRNCIEQVTSKKCPHCHEKFDQLKQDLKSSRIIQDQEIKCPYHIYNKCSWTGFNENISEHLQTCQYRIVECPNNCGKCYERHNILLHINMECEVGVVQCHQCGRYFKISDYTSHLSDTSQSNTEVEAVATDLNVPTQHVPDKMVKCQFAECGCGVVTVPDKMDQHLCDATQDHLAMLWEVIRAERNARKCLEQQLEEEKLARTNLEKRVYDLQKNLRK